MTYSISFRNSEEGQFSHPRHVAVDSALEYVYVADSRNHRIQKFDINGNFVESLEQKVTRVANLIYLLQ